MRKKCFIANSLSLSLHYVFVFRESGYNLKVIIDQMRMCLNDLNDAESEIQLVNILQEMDELDVTNVT